MPAQRRLSGASSAALRSAKWQFTPVKILSRAVPPPAIAKKLPRLPRDLNGGKLLPNEAIVRTQPGLVFELEPGYGINQTFIGRLQHGAQFKGAHYYLGGHWEQTAGARGANEEETVAAQAKVDVDLSPRVKIFSDGAYFHSDVALPQLAADQHQQKSAMRLNAGLQIKFDPDLDLALAFSGEQARLAAQPPATFTLNRYGGQLTLKQLWSLTNMVNFQAAGYREEYVRADASLGDRTYGTGTLTDSFTLHGGLSIEAGVRGAYYQAAHAPETEYLLAPVAAARLRLFHNTSVYAAYQPRLKFPDFTELYLRTLYTTVNPDLFAEKERHAVEAGIQQRIGDSVVLNASLFYHENQDMILQIDANNDHLLEYDQSASADVMGVKVNLQVNYKDWFVQNITYTYRQYHLLAGDAGTVPDAEMFPYQPSHQVQASIYWKTPFGLILDCNGTYVSEQLRNWNPTQDRIGRRFFLNANLTQYITENFQIFLLGRNLTDADTYDIIPLLDSEEITSSRLFIGGIRLRF